MRSSTEVKLVVVYDVISMVLWTKYLFKVQVYSVNTYIFQDNQSSMFLEKNVRSSSGNRTRNVNIIYYFVADGVKCGEVKIKYCSMYDMIGNFFTKTLQVPTLGNLGNKY